MKTNHFYISYFGNKRTEAKYLYDLLDLTNITTIIEPFCGSCAISYYISTLHPGKFKYVFNDNDHYLKEMYEIIINEKKLKDFQMVVDNLVNNIQCKDEYNTIVRQKNIYSWFIKNKVYCMRPGMYKLDYKYDSFKTDILKAPICDFFIKEQQNITFTTNDANECYINYKDDIKNVIILDPPYLTSNNTFYSHPLLDIFNYLFKHSINDEKAYIYLILEKTLIMAKVFDNLELYIYDKGYSTNNIKKVNNNTVINGKRKTEHMICYKKILEDEYIIIDSKK